MVSQVMAEVLDWVVIEHAELLPQIESFCTENELGQLQFVALDRPVSASKAMGNSGFPLPNILKIEEPLQEWGSKFFSRFYLLDDDTNFWDKFGNSWPDAPIEMLSSSGIRMSDASEAWAQSSQDHLVFYSDSRK